MLFAASPTRSRSALILITLRMKRRSPAMGCSIASRSSADWSMSRSMRLMATSTAGNKIADGDVAHPIGFNGPLNRLFGEASHHQEVLF